jgi:hypothetical protein
MPMWISWTDPRTGQRKRIYNYFDQGTPDGENGVAVARRALQLRHGYRVTLIVEPAPWLSLYQRHVAPPLLRHQHQVKHKRPAIMQGRE